MGKTFTKRELRYYAQRKAERQQWIDMRSAALARVETAKTLEQLNEVARDFLIADADLYKFNHPRETENSAVMYRRANSDAYRETWCVWTLANRMKKEADSSHDMTPEERAAYEARCKAERAALQAAIDGMLRAALRA